MFTYIGQFFIWIVTAMLVENTVFSRALGTSPMLLVVNKSKNFLLFGAVITTITTISSVFTWAVFYLLKGFTYRYMFEPLVLVVTLGILYFFAYYILTKLNKETCNAIKAVLPYAMFNCAVVGSMLIIVHNKLDLANSIAFGIGSGLGFLLAGFFVNEGQKLIQKADIPKPFKGLPITLLFIGILSLAFYGLTGHILAI